MVIHKRQGFAVVVLEPAKTWIKQNKCGGCGKPKEEWKRTAIWRNCSVECTLKFNESYRYFGWSDVRERVFVRDKWTCVVCLNESFKSLIEQEKFFLENGKTDWEESHKTEYVKNQMKDWLKSQLDADHIIPIAIGGQEWEMNNIQTLCKACHKLKTKKDIKKISSERKITIDQQRLI